MATTLTMDELLLDTLDAFKVQAPMLKAFSTDLSSKTAVKGDTIKAKIRSLPTVADVHATTGFANGAVEAETLITDVPVTMDQLKHVPVKIDWTTQVGSKRQLYLDAVNDTAYVLAKSMIDAALAEVTAANITHSVTKASANVDASTMEEIRTQLNTQKAYGKGRFGFINPTVAAYLQQDPIIASNLYYGQKNGAEGFRRFSNVAGFENIWEYADLPTAGNLTGFFGDPRAVVICSRVPNFANGAEVCAALGIPQVMRFSTVTDPDTGLTLMGVAWQVAGVGDIYTSVAALYGTAVGAQAGGADAITDPAGVRLISA